MYLVTVVRTDGPVTVELNWMWMPTFLGVSNVFKKELEAWLGPQLVGRELTDETLDWAHNQVLNFVCKKYEYIDGLRDYLDAVKFVVEK